MHDRYTGGECIIYMIGYSKKVIVKDSTFWQLQDVITTVVSLQVISYFPSCIQITI